MPPPLPPEVEAALEALRSVVAARVQAPPAEAQEPLEVGGLTLPPLPVDLHGLLVAVEDLYLDRALHQAGGNRAAAAHLLGLRRTTLVEKLKRRAHAQPRTDGPAAD